jgi:mitochondrial intermembrane space import and assembly protein 40
MALRRGMHTTSSANPAGGLSRHRFAMAAGASVIAASYLGWRIHLGSQRIALDSDSARTIGFRFLTSYPLQLKVLLATTSKPKPKPLTREARARSTADTLSAPPSEPPEPRADRIDHKDDEAPSEEGEEEEGGASSGEGGGGGGAFDPVTGKINWDCPCLGGMAYGPCGMQFREAFSCFVFSEAEPKGMDCVEKFKAMQDCFRENPDVYGEGTRQTFPLPSQLAFFFFF